MEQKAEPVCMFLYRFILDYSVGNSVLCGGDFPSSFTNLLNKCEKLSSRHFGNNKHNKDSSHPHSL